MRLFIALTLSAEDQDRIRKATAPLRKAGLPFRWTPPAALHLTLKFLGACRPRKVREIEGAVAIAAARTKPFNLPLGGFGAFPSLRQPQVLWLRAEATPQLRCLKQDIEWELAPVGFERETRAFQPHLTLGRSSAEARAGGFRVLESLLQELDYEAAPEITGVDLMRSRGTSTGATYERIAAVPLG